MISKTLNFLAFQANWLACVLGAASGLPWLGPLTTAVLIVEFVRRSRRRVPVLWLLLTALLMGLVVDSGLTIAGRLQFIELTAGPWPPVAPPWILALWLALATTLDSSMGWLRERPYLAALLGAVSGPLTYLAGDRLGAVQLGAPLSLSLATLALVWAICLPALFHAQRRLGAIDAPGA